MIAVEKGDVFIEKKCIDLSGYWIYLIHPSIHVSTKDAYSSITPLTNRKHISDILKQDITTWKKELINDFELSVFNTFPQLMDIKHALYANGAVYAAMSGSGSTLFGIFKNKPQQIAVPSKNISFLIAEL
jgi:4-diphosphocytidyl-2-C-methyl-D-erythritol kinase